MNAHAQCLNNTKKWRHKVTFKKTSSKFRGAIRGAVNHVKKENAKWQKHPRNPSIRQDQRFTLK